jgi:hypothetical protein
MVRLVLQHVLDVGGVGQEVGLPDPQGQRDHRPIAARGRGQVPERVAPQLREDAQGRIAPWTGDDRRPAGASHVSSDDDHGPRLAV